MCTFSLPVAQATDSGLKILLQLIEGSVVPPGLLLSSEYHLALQSCLDDLLAGI